MRHPLSGHAGRAHEFAADARLDRIPVISAARPARRCRPPRDQDTRGVTRTSRCSASGRYLPHMTAIQLVEGCAARQVPRLRLVGSDLVPGPWPEATQRPTWRSRTARPVRCTPSWRCAVAVRFTSGLDGGSLPRRPRMTSRSGSAGNGHVRRPCDAESGQDSDRVGGDVVAARAGAAAHAPRIISSTRAFVELAQSDYRRTTYPRSL